MARPRQTQRLDGAKMQPLASTSRSSEESGEIHGPDTTASKSIKVALYEHRTPCARGRHGSDSGGSIPSIGANQHDDVR